MGLLSHHSSTLLTMDLTPLLAAALGGAIALTAQLAAARSSRQVAQRQIDYERWEAWRRESADVWADLLFGVRSLDVDFGDLACLSDSQLEEVRDRTRRLIHSLDRLSALALDRQVGDWSQQLGGLIASLSLLLPSHTGCDDEERAREYQDHRHLLHAQFDWNDGDRSSQLDRFRDALTASTDPPDRVHKRRHGAGHRLR